MGLSNPSKAIRELDQDEKSEFVISPEDLVTFGSANSNSSDLRPKKHQTVNEPGLYQLIIQRGGCDFLNDSLILPDYPKPGQ